MATTNEKVVLEKAPEPLKDTHTNPLQAFLPFSKENYWIMLFGIALIFIGFYIMAQDKELYGFGFLGLTLGPIVAFLGFIVQFFAIFWKKKSA